MPTNQYDKIIRYLQRKKGGITSAEAVVKLNILNLTTRLSKLKQNGYEFVAVRETDGFTNWNRYFLKSTPKN